MRLALPACAALAIAACSHHYAASPHAGSHAPAVAEIGRTHAPYTGKPKYLAEARPLLPTTSRPGGGNPCAVRSQACDDRLRAVLASLDGQILALSTPPTDLQLSALRLQLAELGPLLAPYPDMASERDELGTVVDKLPSLSVVDQGAARRRMTELSDLLRVQLAAAQ